MIKKKKNILPYIISILFLIPICILASFYPVETLIGTLVIVVSIIIFVSIFHKRDKTLSYLACLLLLSLYLTSDINIGGVGLRVDDYIAIFMTIGLFSIIYSKKGYFKNVSIIKWLVIYLSYCFLITLSHLIFNDLNPILILYFIKEIQYFVYFFIFYHLSRNYSIFENHFKKYFLFVALLTIGWGVFQLITGNIFGYYGIGIISISAPSQSGIVLFLTSLFLFYMSLTIKEKRKSFLPTIVSLISVALTFATISRTAISVLIGIIIVYLLISMFRRWNFKKIFIGVCFSILLTPLGITLIGDKLGYSILERFSRFGQGAAGRMDFWKSFLEQSSTLGHIFGNGKGFMQEIVGTFTLKADSQYVRLILEVGVIGLVLWLLMLGSILIFSIKHLKISYYDSLFLFLLTLSFMIVGITQEGYLVSIQGSLYWIISGYFIGNIIRKKFFEKNTDTMKL